MIWLEKKTLHASRRIIKQLGRSFIIVALCILLPAMPALAQEEKKRNYEVDCVERISCAYYDPNECADPDGTGIGNSDEATRHKDVRVTGVEPPYILEEFAIETLRSVAIKRNVDVNSVVTEEHVIALLAFMLGEGGDIANRWLFNPLNTGLAHAELIDGEAQADGTQSFKSFDAGVEATARTLVGNNQSRLADKLIDKNSTAAHFMEALTFYKRYPGNFFWAAASLPNPEKYYQERLSLVRQVRSDYTKIAATMMGTPFKEFEMGMTAKEDQLQFKPAPIESIRAVLGGGTSGSGCENGSPGIISGEITTTALALAWPSIENSHVVYPSDADGGKSKAKPLYQETMPRVNGSKGIREYSDCGVFTSTVMLASQADPTYPKRGTGVHKQYVLDNQDKYQIIHDPRSTSQLQPGDILIKNNGGGIGHTYIFTGTYTGSDGKTYNAASASLAWSSPGHVPQGENWYYESGYLAARLIKKDTSATQPPRNIIAE